MQWYDEIENPGPVETGTGGSRQVTQQQYDKTPNHASDPVNETAFPAPADIDISAFEEGAKAHDDFQAADFRGGQAGYSAQTLIVPTTFRLSNTPPPPRPWLYGQHLCRQMVSGTVAPGGVGKSSLAMVDAVAMVTGRKLLQNWCHNESGLRVWYWCGEDPRAELERRFFAICRHYSITSEMIGGRLFVDSGRDQPIKIVVIGEGKIPVAMPIKADLIRVMKERGIDALTIDPFVSSHAVGENDNEAINAVIDAWRDVANETNAAIELIHHANKAGKGDSIGDGRGASAFADGIRGGRVLAPLSLEEGEALGLDPSETARIVKVLDGAKPNMQRRSLGRSYYRMASVRLDNGNEEYPEGDEIGVAEVWTPPDAFEEVSLNDLARVQEAIAAREIAPAQNAQSHDWIGYIVAEVMGLDVGEPGTAQKDRSGEQNRTRARVTKMINTWIRSKALRVETRPSTRDGRDVKCLVVGEPAVADLQPHPPQSTAE